MIGGIVVCAENVNPAARSVQSVEVINPGAGYTIAPKYYFLEMGLEQLLQQLLEIILLE
jgi:hypothetical protein